MSSADGALLNQIALGDERALSKLYQLLAPQAYAIAFKVLNDSSDAEEVLQDTFLEVWRSAARYDPRRAPAYRWVAMMIRTRAIDRLRARHSRERALEVDALVPVSRTPSVEDLLVTGELRLRVRKALVALPDAQRNTLELAYFSDLTQSEIAAATAVPIGTVKTRMRQAMIKLAATLP